MTRSIPVVTVCSWTTACFRQEDNTMCTEASYPFTATDGTCNLSGCQVSIPQGGVVDYTDVSTDSEQAMMSAVAQQHVSIAGLLKCTNGRPRVSDETAWPRRGVDDVVRNVPISHLHHMRAASTCPFMLVSLHISHPLSSDLSCALVHS